jgi:hypothetical protein
MIKHFVDIMQGSRHFIFIAVSQIHQVTGFILQVYIGDVRCPENNIFVPSSKDHPPAIPDDCTFHDKK